MTGREWLRARVLRERSRRLATGGVITPGPPLPLAGCTGDGYRLPQREPVPAADAPAITLHLDHDPASVREFADRMREAVGIRTAPTPPPTAADRPRPRPDGTNCGCVPRYTRCYCPGPRTMDT